MLTAVWAAEHHIELRPNPAQMDRTGANSTIVYSALPAVGEKRKKEKKHKEKKDKKHKKDHKKHKKHKKHKDKKHKDHKHSSHSQSPSLSRSPSLTELLDRSNPFSAATTGALEALQKLAADQVRLGWVRAFSPSGLLQGSESVVGAVDESGDRPLHLAAKRGHIDCVTWLLQVPSTTAYARVSADDWLWCAARRRCKQQQQVRGYRNARGCGGQSDGYLYGAIDSTRRDAAG